MVNGAALWPLGDQSNGLCVCGAIGVVSITSLKEAVRQ
jgi:hypothetical protein